MRSRALRTCLLCLVALAVSVDCGHAEPVLLRNVVTEPPPSWTGPHWVVANLHSHTLGTTLVDDGKETPAELHLAARKAGVDFSLHTIHSFFNRKGFDGRAPFEAERAAESQLRVPGLNIAVGQELTVAPGAQYKARDTMFGYPVPGNLDHLTVLGASQYIANYTPLKEACEAVHRSGGVCLVNHPGPGPSQWEPGLWEKPEHRGLIDGLEVYNGVGISTVGWSSEDRYLDASSPKGLGCHLAAIASPDTHGPHQVKELRARIGSNVAAKMLGVLTPEVPLERPELSSLTLVQADSSSERAVVAAIKQRKTVAVFGLPGFRLDVPGLGEVRHQKEVALSATFSQPLDKVTLYRNGVAVKTWTDAKHVEFNGHTDENAAYVFGAREGSYARLMTSAIWYEPK
jgi:hypothetical protein